MRTNAEIQTKSNDLSLKVSASSYEFVSASISVRNPYQCLFHHRCIDFLLVIHAHRQNLFFALVFVWSQSCCLLNTQCRRASRLVWHCAVHILTPCHFEAHCKENFNRSSRASILGSEFSCRIFLSFKSKGFIWEEHYFRPRKNQTKKSGTRKRSVLNYLANKIGALLKNDNSPSYPDGAGKSPSNSGWLRGKFAELSGSIQEKSPSIC